MNPLRFLAAAASAASILTCSALGSSGARHYFADSIRQPDASVGAQIVRQGLTARELAAPMSFSVTLRMRNLAELQARVAQGQIVPRDEMEAKYLPSAADYQALGAWLSGQGLTLEQADPNHTHLFVRGTVAQIQGALGMSFARVANENGEFTSAVTAPALPAEVSDAVLAFGGLQPHFQRHRHSRVLGDLLTVTSNQGKQTVVAPSDLRAAYQAPANLTGAGQTIAIIMAATVSSSDLTTFYTNVGSSQVASNVTTVTIGSGPSNSSQSTNGSEAALDVEWSSAMAPGANVRLYAITSLSDSGIEAAAARILSDIASGINITVVSMSFGGAEIGDSAGSLNALDQSFVQLAAAGVSCFASSDDGGSNPNVRSGTYSPNNALSASTPADDPNVMGVGGTTVQFNSSGAYAGEVVWNEIGSSNSAASGGGISQLFAKPSYQSDGGSLLASQAARCVPDIAAMSTGSVNGSGVFALVVQNGQGLLIGGTSLSSPVDAGLFALVNQARASVGAKPLGNPGASIYPLHASAFNDVTSGNNGFYSAGTGYDLCTGLGTLNVTALVSALAPSPPTITSQPQSTSATVGGSFSLSVTATGSGTLAYQWFENGAALAGQTSSTFFNGNAQTSDGGSYDVVVSNAAGSVTSSMATVTVSAAVTAAAAPAGGGGGGGGGGAPSLWFYAVLAALVGLRGRRRLPAAA